MAAFSGETAVKGIHLINDDGELLPEADINDFLISALAGKGSSDILYRTGVNYHVVGVFGGQSSGKSTLLNSLFQTEFMTMDEAHHRGQTTKGAFMTRAILDAQTHRKEREEGEGADLLKREKPQPLFVLDFEGTDGIERGEDQNFERQLSLFALSVADILIINMWAVDVGRFNAANMNLLRTVFEVNLQLFSHGSYVKEEKPTLLVVLRDFTENDPAPSFETVRKSFDKIWGNIQKPESFTDATIDVVFDLRYRVLPHYKLQRPEFDSAVSEFREWFVSPKNSNFLFSNCSMFRGVPADGMPSYLSNCWNAICSSKDLDIPTQRDMLARHRCADAKHAAIEEFKDVCEEYTKKIQRGDVIPQFTRALEETIERLLKNFSDQTKLYKVSVVHETAEALEEELGDMELHLLKQYAKSIAVTVLVALDGVIGSSVDEAVRWLQNEARSVLLLGGKDNKGDRIDGGGLAQGVLDTAEGLVDNKRCRLFVEEFWKRICSSLQGAFDMLNGCSKSHQAALSSLYGKFATAIMDDQAVREGVAHAAMEGAQHKLRNRFVAMAENAAETVHQVFEQALTSKTDGTVRFFRTTDGLLGAEKQARQAGLVLLGCLLYYRLKLVPVEVDAGEVEGEGTTRALQRLVRDRCRFQVRDNRTEKNFFLHFTNISDVPRYPLDAPTSVVDSGDTTADTVNADNVLLSHNALQRAFHLYKQKSDFTLQMQLRNIESGKQSLPPWVLPVMLLLGWNELYYLLTSPILLIAIIVIAVLFFKTFLKSQLEVLEEKCPVWLVVSVKALLQQAQALQNAYAPTEAVRGGGGGAQFRDPTQPTSVSGASAGVSSESSSAASPRRRVCRESRDKGED